MTTYRVGHFTNLTAQDVVDLIGFRVARLTETERKILPERLSYHDLALFFYDVRELVLVTERQEDAG